MPASRDRVPERALDVHEPAELQPARDGPTIIGLGKEALLTRLTTIRSRDHHAAIDYVFEVARRRNAFVFTTTYVFAEVIGTVRSGKDSNTVEALWEDLQNSNISVLHDGERWDTPADVTDDPDDSPFRPPISQFKNIQQLYSEQPDLDFKFHEGSLVLNAISLEERSRADSVAVCIASFDGALWALGTRLGVDVLPSTTPLRSDEAYRATE